MIEEGLHAWLAADPAVAVLVVEGKTARIYPFNLPQGAKLPALTYNKISSVSDRHLTGRSGLARARVQVDCYGETPAAVKELKEAVRLSLDHRDGPAASETIRAAFLDTERDLYEDELTPPVYRVSLDFTIWHDQP